MLLISKTYFNLIVFIDHKIICGKVEMHHASNRIDTLDVEVLIICHKKTLFVLSFFLAEAILVATFL